MASEGGTDKVSRQNSATILICFVCERNRKWWGAISFSLHFKGKDSYRRAYLSLTNSAQYPISPPWRALCHLWRCLQEAEVLDRGFCDLWALKNQHWPHSGFAIHADMASESSGKFQGAEWVESSPLPQGLAWLQTWGPRVTGRRQRKVLDVKWDWETIRHWCGFCCPPSAVQSSVTPDIIFHFEDSPSETLQAEMSTSSQPPLCFYVDLQFWATDSGNN